MKLGTTYHWMLVARVGARLYSITDDKMEFRIDQVHELPITQEDRQEGGFIVYRTKKEALSAQVPPNSRLFINPRVLLKCLAWGECIDYGSELAFSCIRPVEAQPCPFGYLSHTFSQRKHTEIMLTQTRRRMRPFYSPVAPFPKEYRQRAQNEQLRARQRSLTSTLNDLRPRTSLGLARSRTFASAGASTGVISAGSGAALYLEG